MSRPRYKLFDEDENSQRSTRRLEQRKIVLMIKMRQVTLNGVLHVVTYFQDLTDSVGEIEMVNRHAYVNFILGSSEFKESLNSTSKCL